MVSNKLNYMMYDCTMYMYADDTTHLNLEDFDCRNLDDVVKPEITK